MGTLSTTQRDVTRAGIGVLARFATPGLSTLAVFALLATLVPSPAAAGVTTRTAVEFSLILGYSDDSGLVGSLPGSQRSAAGFEHFAKFSTESGDVVTTDLQVRASHDSRASGDDSWALELHNAWIEYRLGLGRKLRLGHFSPAHGLEPVRDTHGTLAQTLSMMDLGFKKDWGLGYSGIAGPADLEIALQLGSGMAPAQDDGSYLASAQVWTPPGHDSRFGFSVVRGRVRSAERPRTFPLPEYADGAVDVGRVGLAAEHTAGPFTLLAEVSAGKNDASRTGGALLEVDYSPPSSRQLQLEWQIRLWDDDLERGGAGLVSGLVGASYTMTDRLTVRAAVTEAVRDGDHLELQATIQLYYYGG